MADKPADIKLSEKVGKGEAVFGSAAEYAAYVNFGTRYQDAQAFLSTAGEILATRLVRTITAEQQKAMMREISSSFDKQRKDGVEIIRYGKPTDGIEIGNKASVLQAAVAGTSQAKAICPVAKVNGGYLRNSIMWKTEDQEGGFNVR